MFAARPLFRVWCLALPLALGISGCETMEKLNPFAEKQTPLPGERKPLFPEGVPGVEFGAPPPQPSNSNIPIAPAAVETQQQAPAQIEQQQLQPQQQQQQSQARAPQPIHPASGQSKSKTGNSGDAWDGTR